MLRAAGARVNPDRIPEGDGPPRALRRRERALAVCVVIDRVSKTYVDRPGQAVEALGDVSLTVESEEFVALQEPALFPWRTVQANIEFGLEELGEGYIRSSRHHVERSSRSRRSIPVPARTSSAAASPIRIATAG